MVGLTCDILATGVDITNQPKRGPYQKLDPGRPKSSHESGALFSVLSDKKDLPVQS